MEVTKISEEAFNKAMEVLGLSKSEASTTANVPAEKTADEIKKAEQDQEKKKIEEELSATLKKAEELKAKLTNDTTINKADESNSLQAESKIDDKLIKGLEDKINSLGTVITFNKQENADLKKINDDLKKSIDIQSEFLAKLGEKIGMIEKQPLERKSLTGAKYVERFEKGEGAAAGGSKEKVLSISTKNDRAELADVLFKAAVNEDGSIKDKELEKAVGYVELGSFPDVAFAQRIINRLKSEHNIIVTK